MSITRNTARSRRLRGLATLAAMAVLVWPAAAEPATGDIAIKHIIPHNREGKETCFEGTFSDKTIDTQQWPTYAEQIAPATDANGNPRPNAKVVDHPSQSISHVALYLDYTNGRAREESWDFTFTVRVTSPSLGKELFARSGCAWSGWNHEEQKEVTPEFMLACWIECDGGGMRAKRIPGTASLNLVFDRLRMQAGCEGGGAYSLGTSEKKVMFRLERAPLSVCKPLKAWNRD